MRVVRPILNALRAAAWWPLRTVARLTPDGGLFLALAVACGLVAALAGSWSNVPLLASLVLLAVWLLAAGLGPWCLRGLSMTRSGPQRTFPNEALTYQVQVANRARLPVGGLVVTESIEAEPPEHTAGKDARSDETPTRALAPVAQARTLVVAVPGRGTGTARYTIAVRRRGLYRFGAAAVETTFPFGFFQSALPCRVNGRLVVYPALGEVGLGFYDELERALQPMRRARMSRTEDQFRGLREYRREDNPRWIHWRSSARAQKLVVREYEEPQSRRVLLLLDTNLQRLGARRGGAFEQAISFAATVTRDLARRGIETEFAALQPGERWVHCSVNRDRRNLDTLLELLAGLRRDDARTLASFQTVLPRRTLHGAYVLVVGLGSLRQRPSLSFLNTPDNAVRIVDARGEEFRQVFQRASSRSLRDETEEDLELSLVDEPETEAAPVRGR